MRLDIISVLPTMMEGFFQESILARAQKKGLVDIQLHNLRDYSTDKWRRADDYPYGGSAGMVMQCEPIDRCISALQAQRHYDEVIYMSPDGETFNQHIANELSLKGNLIMLCGHYKGIDQRIREHLITRELSIGDYVLTGDELAAAAITEAATRSSVPVTVSTELPDLPDHVSQAAYFVVSEALANLNKYSGATAAGVDARVADGALTPVAPAGATPESEA